MIIDISIPIVLSHICSEEDIEMIPRGHLIYSNDSIVCDSAIYALFKIQNFLKNYKESDKFISNIDLYENILNNVNTMCSKENLNFLNSEVLKLKIFINIFKMKSKMVYLFSKIAFDQCFVRVKKEYKEFIKYLAIDKSQTFVNNSNHLYLKTKRQRNINELPDDREFV